MSQAKVPIWRTSDFSVACYLFAQGVKIRKFEKVPGTRNQHTFFFEDDFKRGGQHCPCSQLELEYVNSESYRFDAAQRALKKLCINSRERDSYRR
jgi:hypothetical protein